MRRHILFTLLAAALVMVAASAPVHALNVYSNPSIQTGNTNPDGSYNEGNSMQVVSDKFVSKCAARGFGTRDSNWLSLASACSDAVNWGANCFVAEHTDASGNTSAHGTHGLYYQSSGGWWDPNDRDLCVKAVDRCVEQFGTAGRGAYIFGGYNGDWAFYGTYNLYVLNNTPNMNSILVEGLFHTNVDDTNLLKTDNGKNLYAEGLYRGVCQHYGYSYTTTPTLDSVYNNQSYTGNLSPGQQATCWAEYKNTGTDTWQQGGSNPVHLGTSNPQDRDSVFYTAGNWLNPKRPSDMDQTSVAPNGIARFTFIMTGPVGNYGYHQENWRLVSESRAWFGYDGVWFGVNANPFDVVVDNNSSAFAASANWATGSSSADKYGADYRFRATEAISDQATWTVNVPRAGNYDVFAWWPQGANRSTSAGYTVDYNGGTATVQQNQQANGGKWNVLGRWNFNADNNTVHLSCWSAAGYVVIADAVRFVGPY